jgi:O-antigen ligase
MSVPSEILKNPREHLLRPLALPAGVVTVGLAALAAGAGSALVATHFKGYTAPLILVVMFVAPLLALAIVVNPLIAILVVLATFPIGSIAQGIGPLRIQAVEAAVFVAAVVVVLRRLAVGKVPLPFAAPLAWAVALFLWTLISLLSAIDETRAIKVLFSLLGGLICATVVLAGCRDMRDLRIILGGFVAVGTVIAIITLSEAGSISTAYGGAQTVTGRLQGAFDSPNQLGALCAMTIPIAFALIFGAQTMRFRVLAGLAIPLLFASLALSLSRGAWVGTAVAVGFLLFRLREARRLLLVAAIPLAIIGFFLWSLAPPAADVKVVGERAKAITILSPYDDRRVIYREAEREIKDHPVLGVGPGGFSVASTRVVSESATLSYDHAHNLYLNWAAEVGIPSVLLIFGFGIALAFAALTASRGAIARGDPGDRALVLGIGAALLSVLAQGMFDYVVANPVSHLAMWTLIGALLVARREGLETLGQASAAKG